MFVGLVKLIIFMSFAGGSVFSLQVYDEYDQAKKLDPNVKLMDIIRSQGDRWMEKAGEIARLEKKAKGEIKKIALGEIKKALRIYHLDHGEYPTRIQDLIGEYIEADAEIIQEDSFYYRKQFSGYRLGITLDTGEKYEIKK